MRYWFQINGYMKGQWAQWELQKTTGKLQGTTENYLSMKKDIETINKSGGNEEYNFWIEKHSSCLLYTSDAADDPRVV